MKKYAICAAMLVLTAAVLAGCRNPNMDPTTEPTQTVTLPTIAPTTPHTSQPTTPATEEPTIGEGGTMPSDATAGIGETGAVEGETGNAGTQGRSRTPGMR